MAQRSFTSPVGEPSADSPVRAIALRLAAMAMLSTMFMLVKLAGERGVSIPELIFWRQAMALPLMLGALAATGRLRVLATRRLGGHALRAATGTAGLVCNIGAATLLPLPVSTTLGFTTPFFAVLITALVLRQKVGPWRWGALVAGFAGVLVVTRPGGALAGLPPLGLAAGVGAGVIVAIVSFQIRALARTEPPVACVFWFSCFGALYTAAVLPFYAVPHPPEEWLLLVAVGLTGTLAQMLITASLRHAPVATVVVVDYTALVWATLYGWIVWHALPPHALWLGAPLIVGAGLLITWREHVLARAISPTSALDAQAAAAPSSTSHARAALPGPAGT